MQKWIIFLLLIITGILVYFNLVPGSKQSLVSPLSQQIVQTVTKPLQKYSFPNLKNTIPQASQIELTSVLEEQPAYIAHLFTYIAEGKHMTGQLNEPQMATPSGGFPVIILIRGYVDKEIYQTGIGTKNAAAYFAKNGYVTLAPDFLGYGGSDNPENDILAERFARPLHIMDLLASLNSVSFINPNRVGIWAHSNGGQIALSVLEITGKPIPTVLWAPVSKPFPFSVLFYTDEAPDQGKSLRKTIADFEQIYDAYEFTLDKYWDWLAAPLELHQGTADAAVPIAWSDELNTTLRDLKKDITYFTYPGADHNLRPGWDLAVTRNLAFFNSHLPED